MRKMLKKVTTILTAGALALGTVSLAACGTSFTPPTGVPSGKAVSNGGFVVEVGEYVYFINGVENYTSDNQYGTPVKGALMRISKSDLAKGENGAETVIPSLMVAADYNSGLYIYDGRVYYATPNNVKNTSGVIENGYLDFKSASLDGTDIKSYFNVSDNSTVYRFVEVDGVVYLVYADGSDLHSYNTETATDTALAENVGEYVLNSTDKEDPYLYYTMKVTSQIDVVGGSVDRDYNQIYRVRADAVTAPYEYTYSEEYLDENDGEEPYCNLGEIVLDGIGNVYVESPTQFTHDLEGTTPSSALGYTYNLEAYVNGGIYFTRSDLATTSTTGEDGWLYYLPVSKLGKANGWNSVSGNEKSNLDVVAQNTDNANTSAIFYLDDAGVHHYLYVSNSNLFRADVTGTNGEAETLLIARGVGSATLAFIDNEVEGPYDYVYYTSSGNAGNDIYRVVYNGEEKDYKSLNYEANKPYRATQILDIEHARSWYNFEILDGRLFYADAESIGNLSYNYVSYVNLTDKNGKMMDNAALADYNDVYGQIIGNDGYITSLSDSGKTTLSTAIRYFFFTGSTKYFEENIQEAIDAGKAEEYLYNKTEQETFKAFANGTGDAEKYKDINERSYFIHQIGEVNEADEEALDTYWKNILQHYEEPEADDTTPAWAWALIGVGIGLCVVGIVVAVVFIVRTRKTSDAPEEEKMYVDTTDDRSVDVYATEEPVPVTEEQEAAEEEPVEATEEVEEPAELPEEPAEAPVEQPAEAPAEEPAEAPAEEPVEEPTEAPVEEPVEQPAEEPTEAPAEEPEAPQE